MLDAALSIGYTEKKHVSPRDAPVMSDGRCAHRGHSADGAASRRCEQSAASAWGVGRVWEPQKGSWELGREG